MGVDCFIDTNVLVYAAMGRFAEPDKHDQARYVLAHTDFGLSGQVMQEFYVNATRKSDRPLSVAEAVEWLERLKDRPCVAIDQELVIQAARIADRYIISYWDGAIVAAADRLGAPILYSEDLNDGQAYGPVRVVNPFRRQ